MPEVWFVVGSHLVHLAFRNFLISMQGQCKPNAESSLFAEAQPVFANFLQSYDEKAQNPSAENAEICAESSKMLHFNTRIIQNVPFQRNLHLFSLF
jgi:hypothetical protein